ncbi:MAG TPA: copper homeostasis protein CutC [Candidatus Sulfotelmatobacter sp.]|nr:copper homeostasis protein CutC [Candidatus Sulfotelmatobacter sp.]
MQKVLIEVCVDSVASAVAAERGGAERIELCSDLFEGGITPSAGLIESVRARISIGLHVIIRPRPGDFCYSEEEFQVMRRDIQIARDLQVDGMALGILDPAGKIDVRRTRQLVEMALPLNVTFHRAFDMTADVLQSLNDVCATGADRILTSGGAPDSTQGAEAIRQLVETAGDRITIMAGGGIRPPNAAAIVKRTGVREIHVGLGSHIESPMQFRNPRISMGKAQGREYDRTQVLEESVRELKSAVSPSGP